jgi:hypothetical protein
MLDNAFASPVRLATLLLAAGSISCANAGSQPSAPGYTRIDDMEMGEGRIRWLPPDGWPSDQRPGLWSSTTDCSEAPRILPEPYFVNPSGWSYDPVPVPYPTMPGVTSKNAAHLRTKFGQTLDGVWGANIGFDFAEQVGLDGGGPPGESLDAGVSDDGPGCRQGSSRDFNGAQVDLSSYSGIVFWAMAASTGRQVIRVQINNAHTDPRGEVCNAAGRSDKDYCYNGFAKNIMLTAEWRQYQVSFSELRQDPSWGYQPSPDAPDLEQVYSMNFEVPLPGCSADTKATCAGPKAAVSFDVWIDDIYLVNR